MESKQKKRKILIITTDEKIIDEIQKITGNPSLKSLLIDSDETDQQSISVESTKKKKRLLTCVVCGSSANGYNFDAITCESCKAFFRRNALKTSNELECRRDDQCEINIESRRRCSACRLKKCFSNGMKLDHLLTPEQKAKKQEKIEENRRLTSHVKMDQQTINSTDEDLLILNDLTDLISASVANEQRSLLTTEDLQRVETIQLSYQQRIEIAARDGLPWNPSTYANTFLQHLNSRSVSALRLISFFKQIPEFNEIDVSDRITLIKYNLIPLTILNSTLSYRIDSQRIQESDTDAPWDPTIVSQVHGEEFFLEAKRIFESFVRLAQYDSRIIQLALIILILTKGFSTSTSEREPILNDEIAVYRAQNYYTELLWKYLESSYGRQCAVRIFNDLVVYFMSWLKLVSKAGHNLQNQLTTNEINGLLPIMKLLLHIS